MLPNRSNEAEDDISERKAQAEQVVYETEGCWVTPVVITMGLFRISTTHIYFEAKEIKPQSRRKKEEDHKSAKLGKDMKRSLNTIREIHWRRYALQRKALEVFFTDQTNVFFHFDNEEVRNTVYRQLVRQRLPNLKSRGGPPKSVLRKSLTEDWQKRKISNFDYLMQLNTMAGEAMLPAGCV